MPIAALGVNSRALWYLTRGTGLVTMVFLTVTLVLGITQVVRFARPGLPRFVISGLHKNSSLVAMVLLAVHIVTAVGDTFAPISVVNVFVPFTGTYRPLWLGLGALAFDLMIALVVSSLIRERIGLKVWRAIHWAAYASWPVALAHGLGTGTDTKVSWVLFIYTICVATVLGAVAWRLTIDWTPVNAVRRTAAAAVAASAVLAIGIWTVAGPLRAGWARTAGTPTALLGGTRTAAVQQPASPSAPSSSPGTTAPATAPHPLSVPFTDTFSGTINQGGPDGNGTVTVTISGPVTGAVNGQLAVVLEGTPTGGGGVSLSQGQVTFGAASASRQFNGSVVQLSGEEIVASVSDTGGNRMTLRIRVRISKSSSTVAGTVQASA